MNKPLLVLAGAAMLLAAAPDTSTDPTPLPSPPPLSAPADPSASMQPSPVPSGSPAGSPSPSASPFGNIDNGGMGGGMGGRGGMGGGRGGGMGGRGGHGGGGGGPIPTPPPDNRKGIDGVWEVQIQRMANTAYEHFAVIQTGTTLVGTYLDGKGKKYPLSGSLDGTSVRMVVSLADGSTILLEGKLDGTTDMLGMFTDAKERVPFTAAYRPKEKWFENVNPAPGGMGGGGYSPPI